VALARDPAKAADLVRLGVAVRQGDYANPASLIGAFQDVDKLLLVSTSMFGDATTEHLNVIGAARQAGVRHVVYTGIQTAPGSTFHIPVVSDANRATEQALAASGMAVTLLHNSLYQDALPFIIGDVQGADALHVPAGSGVAAVVTRRDLAEANAIVLAGSGHEGKAYTLTAGEAVSLDDIAAIIGRATGRSLRYIDTPLAAYVATHVAAGLPAAVASFMAQWFLAIAAGEFAEPSGDLARLLGRAPLAARDFLPTLFKPA
jgi:NAD(P)H dehydrogenase (quinone)